MGNMGEELTPIYIANMGRMWVVLYADSPPISGFYKRYDFTEDDFDRAKVAARKLVSEYQGKLPDEVKLPDSLL